MKDRYCLNVTSDDDKYSSPMPVIGLYIAAGTFVCALFMIFDIIHGLCRKKPWIPCRFFSINSLTLTLLAIASKLPMDLTTSMPSAQDQLSKLGGTILICVSMSFFSISLATQSDSERLSNMISLTIFVVTVVVNICIQMATGVIFSFIIEHFIIISCMLLLLAMMWFAFEIYIPWNTSPHSAIGELQNVNPPISERKCMIHRLKLVYASSYECNPELEFLDSQIYSSMFMLSLLCALVLLQATLRSLVLKEVKFRCGGSDYEWSMWMVVVSQILTVLVGGMAIAYRWFFSIKSFAYKITKEIDVCSGSPSSILSTLSKLCFMPFFKISKMGFIMFICQTIKRIVIMVLIVVTSVLTVLASLLSLIFYMPRICFDGLRNGDQEATDMEMKQWIERNCEEDIKRLMEKDKRDSLTHLTQLLSKRPPSQESLSSKIPITSNKKVCCLLLVVFVRVATIALPKFHTDSLIRTLDEAFEIIYFIDNKTNYANKRRCSVAKDLWMNRENNCHWFHWRLIRSSVKKFHSCDLKKSMDVEFRSQNELDLSRALGIIEELKATNDRIKYYLFEEVELAGNEIDTVYELIIGKESRQEYTSIDELYGHIEQLFVDMLHFFLSQIPLAIFKHLVESPIKEYEERSRCAIKFLCKVEQLEDKVHWKFPDGTGITGLTTPQVSPIDTQEHV